MQFMLNAYTKIKGVPQKHTSKERTKVSLFINESHIKSGERPLR